MRSKHGLLAATRLANCTAGSTFAACSRAEIGTSAGDLRRLESPNTKDKPR